MCVSWSTKQSYGMCSPLVAQVSKLYHVFFDSLCAWAFLSSLVIPRSQHVTTGGRAFAVSAPRLSNT